jgi:hypothetical protein
MGALKLPRWQILENTTHLHKDLAVAAQKKKDLAVAPALYQHCCLSTCQALEIAY